MGSFILLFLFALVTVQANGNVYPLEVYWHYVLPNTSTPHAIRLLLDQDQEIFKVKEQCTVSYYAAMDRTLPHELTANSLNSSFFMEKNLYPGFQIKQNISALDRRVIGNAFVPRIKADSVPFSMQNYPMILNQFSMAPGSKEARQIEIIIDRCNAPNPEGEQKFCSTSLESMIDGVVSLLKTHDLEAFSTILSESNDEEKTYKITYPIRKFSEEEKLVICHPEASPQAVHYCHTSDSYKGYIVPLEGSDGSTVNAVAVCHHDVKSFTRFFLQVFKVKPDENEPLCHFLPEDHLIWVHTQRLRA